jgi:hypothetical protein
LPSPTSSMGIPSFWTLSFSVRFLNLVVLVWVVCYVILDCLRLASCYCNGWWVQLAIVDPLILLTIIYPSMPNKILLFF